MSGVPIDPEVFTTFEQVKSNQLSYAIYTAGQTIKVESTGVDKTYKDLVEALLRLGIGYAVIRFRYAAADGSEHAPLVFLTWIPDHNTPASQKRIYGSYKDALYRALHGVDLNLQANDESDLREGIEEQITKA